MSSLARPSLAALTLIFVGLFLNSCSPKRLAVNALGNALAGGGSSSFAADEDPEFVGQAIPFALKTMESLLAEAPRHRGLLLGTASGFAQYSYVWLHLEADQVETGGGDLAGATHLRRRAAAMYLRARDYGMRGLALRYRGAGSGGSAADLIAALRRDPARSGEVLRFTRREDVPFLYWTAAAWGGAISLRKNDPELGPDLPVVEALARRALELDETFDAGAIHELLAAYEANRTSVGGSLDKARAHYRRALELSRGERVMSWVAQAENLAVPTQDRALFEEALARALAVDVELQPASRLANEVGQRRARWLLSRKDDLFIE